MEDQRTAAGIHASISSQIFGASLVLIGVLIGYLDIKDIEYSSTPGILTFLSIFLLLVSTFIAGKGLQKLRDNGINGNWSLDSLHIYFRVQTLLNYLCIILFLIIVFKTNGESKEEIFQSKLIEIQTRQLKQDSINDLKNSEQIHLLTNQIDSLNSHFKNLSCCKKRNKKPCP